MADIIGGSGSPIVYVDDTDPLIQYGGGWSAAKDMGIVNGYGFPHYGTLHGASVRTANFSFFYTGTHAIAFFIDDAGSDYSCVFDSVTLLDKRPPAFGTLNTIASCSSFSDVEGQHELKVTVFGNQSNPVFLDYIAYVPSSNVTSADFAYFPGDSPAITLGGSDPNTFALFPYSTLDFVFYGYSVSLRGFFDNEAYSHTPSPASYTIDDGEPVNFTIINSATNTTPLINNQVLLQTPIYPVGQHTLHIVFLGTNDTSPLATADIIVQNQTSHIELTPIPPQPRIHDEKGHHTIIIVAVILATLTAIIFLLTVAFISWRRRVKKRARVSLDLLSIPTTYDHHDFAWINPQDIGSDSKDNGPIVLAPETIFVHVDSGSRPTRIPQPNGGNPDIVEPPPRYETLHDSI